jgi:DNA-binding Lrp family transcriptional regulator
MAAWVLLSIHWSVLCALARHPDATQRALSKELGVSERHVRNVIRDLVNSGILEQVRRGRRNTYRINPGAATPAGLQPVSLDVLLAVLVPESAAMAGNRDGLIESADRLYAVRARLRLVSGRHRELVGRTQMFTKGVWEMLAARRAAGRASGDLTPASSASEAHRQAVS